ncbi:unnamed protein product [Durusdinium trenchii]|uniref:Ubiquitin-like domain-containing protein n=1 Tax=Durusdinium trenchii TaxID=1381693 RepID=A0ABP0P8S6_9DINO
MELEDEEGYRPLHLAGNAEVVDLLLASKASLEAENRVGVKPVHYAARSGHLGVLDRLLQANADVNDRTSYGVRPLHVAAGKGHLSVVDRLLEAKAEVEAENKHGERPLHRAAENHQSHVVKRLLSARADLEAQTNAGWVPTDRGERPLHWAARNGHSDVVERLLAARADPEAQNNDGATPWDDAKKRGHQNVMGLLRPVNIRLMSGNILCFCDPRPDRSVKDLREEVQQKLELEDATQVDLIAKSGEKLRDEDTLGGAGVDYGTSLSAIVVPPEILHFPCGASFLIPSSVAKQGLHPTADFVTDLTSIDVESLERQLEPKESFFHPIFQLSPEDTTFVDPIWVILPACVGASKVWVSTHTGWKDVTNAASFGEGYAKVQLTHFCHVVTTGVPSCIKAMGFLNHGPVSKGKVSFVHIGCTFCMEALETQYMNDHDYLLGYSRCDNVAHLGTRPDSEEVEVSQDGVTRTISLNSSAFPILSNEWSAEASSFTVKIDNRDITFDHLGALSSAQATSPAPSSHAAYPTSNPSGSSPSQPDASTSAALPVVPPSAPRPAYTRRARDSAVPPAAQLMMQDRSRSPSTQAPQVSSSTSGPGTISTAGRWRNRAPNSQAGSAPSSPSSPAPSLSPPVQVRPEPGARVAMFSARFDGGATEQRFRRIHEILAQSGYDILMVGVHPGETFGVPTTRYLGRIKRERGILLCVCTEHYGEMTSSDFSSFEELKFAKVYESFITIIPLRIGDYPPRPPIRGPNWPTHPDVHGDAQSYVDWIFNPARLYLDCQDQSGQDKSDIEVASAIADCLHR